MNIVYSCRKIEKSMKEYLLYRLLFGANRQKKIIKSQIMIAKILKQMQEGITIDNELNDGDSTIINLKIS